MKRLITLALILTLAAFGNALNFEDTDAQEMADSAFERTWARTDFPVQQRQVDRTWMWGPGPNTAGSMEPYADSPGGERLVQYFDKSRMEDNSHRAGPPWDVTNGLLVLELITGMMQVGDDAFVQWEPAVVHVAGDPHPESPTYAMLQPLLDRQPAPTGSPLTQQLHSDGSVTSEDHLAQYGVTAAHHVDVPGINHSVASVFWNFMNSEGTVYQNGQYQNDRLFENPFYATGYPITEAYWVHVPVEGDWQDVMVQCFERRCLTYTPGNVEAWQVEAGNIGQHYHQWRHEEMPAVWNPYRPGETPPVGHAELVPGHPTMMDGVLRLQDILRESGTKINIARTVRLEDNEGATFFAPPGQEDIIGIDRDEFESRAIETGLIIGLVVLEGEPYVEILQSDPDSEEDEVLLLEPGPYVERLRFVDWGAAAPGDWVWEWELIDPNGEVISTTLGPEGPEDPEEPERWVMNTDEFTDVPSGAIYFANSKHCRVRIDSKGVCRPCSLRNYLNRTPRC